ncbi:L-serine ammonia-lyase, iron-sulfur-dependent subunit beta [Agrilactobacillus yilanensis]|uniref:L-serine dehydratase n=1 Tax=Agrilactobacillus yilanensis TaxID=2485997 RepID=A0ABW4J9T8_9LACO|nr:L-serine ammonia-lyase, iron-sulfur-dependent subunit beta [Agrilactobacillus yilanensis]
MSGNYKSVFDIIGPVMIGPSSSHTAGAVAIGRAANRLFGSIPEEITIHYYESFAQTHKGHGTDYAIISGILGFEPDDSRVPNAIKIAEDQGIKIKFIEEDEDSPIGHPNTAVCELKKGSREIVVSGCSIGGGTIEIRDIKMDGFHIKPKGPLPILLVQSADTQSTENISDKLSKINTINHHAEYAGAGHATMYEYDLENRLKDKDLNALSSDSTKMVYL